MNAVQNAYNKMAFRIKIQNDVIMKKRQRFLFSVNIYRGLILSYLLRYHREQDRRDSAFMELRF